MKKYYIFIIFFLAANIRLQAQIPNHTSSKSESASLEGSKTVYKIIVAPDKTFGYDIFQDGILLVHQPFMPGLPGKKGFTRKSDAEKVAELVIKKIQKGLMPPSIELKELDSLKIKH